MNGGHYAGRRLILACIIAVGIGAAGWWLLRAPMRSIASERQRGSETATGGPALLVDAIEVRAARVQPENALSGQVEPYQVATVAAEVARRILSRPVHQGDRVAAGELLAALDSEAARTALDQATAAAAQATATRRQAETDYARMVVETDAARQQARAQLAQATAGRQQARAQVAAATAGAQKARSFTRTQELRQAQAALAQAQTDEHLAKIEADRYTMLVREGAAPQQTLDRAQATLDAASARRQAAEQAVSLAQEGARQEDIDAAVAQVQAAQAQEAQSGAQIEAARAAVRIADTRDTRLSTLRHQIEGLKAQEAQAADAVRQARIALDKCSVIAPFPGRVLATLAEAGEMAAPGTPLIRIGAIDRVKVTFAVPEASRVVLRLGQPVTITADALPGQRFAGRITLLGFQADPRTRTFPIEVTVQNPQERLLPNMVARLRLPVGPAALRVLVPVGAVATDGATSYVLVLQNGQAVRRDVTLGAPVSTDVEVLRGLEPGERIAATPQRLTDGATVRYAPGVGR